jgi:hypothetical protein
MSPGRGVGGAVAGAWRRGRVSARRDGHPARPRDEAEPQGRHLRRARRRALARKPRPASAARLDLAALAGVLGVRAVPPYFASTAPVLTPMCARHHRRLRPLATNPAGASGLAGRVLPPRRHGLRLLLAFPRPDRALGRGPSADHQPAHDEEARRRQAGEVREGDRERVGEEPIFSCAHGAGLRCASSPSSPSRA